jgi:pimeloyl-ACP methyl ester carboxylesterase
MEAPLGRVGLGMLVALALVLPGEAGADTLGYCNQSSTQLDPVDVPQEGSASVPVAGVRERNLELAGVDTRVLDSGNPESTTAVIFLHGSPGSSADWATLLPQVAGPSARAIAFDLPGYGHAEEIWGISGGLDAATDYLNQALDQLGVRRVHLVAHDVGGAVAMEWGARHPKRLRSATLIDTGLMLGYKHHQLAQISRTPDAGEAFWLQLTRPFFHLGLQQGQTPQRPLPFEFVDRLYDDLDRETRCAIITLYRAATEEEINAFAEHQADVLSRWPDRPALVIWGANDPYLPAEMADRQREGFPSARVEIFGDSGHWPFADNPGRTQDLLVPFVRGAIERDTGSRP